MWTLLQRLGYVAAVGVACFYVFLVLKGPGGIPRMIESRQQVERMKRDNEALREEIRRRKENIEHLENSSDARDRAVREHTNKTKERETTVFLPEDGASSKSAR